MLRFPGSQIKTLSSPDYNLMSQVQFSVRIGRERRERSCIVDFTDFTHSLFGFNSGGPVVLPRARVPIDSFTYTSHTTRYRLWQLPPANSQEIRLYIRTEQSISCKLPAFCFPLSAPCYCSLFIDRWVMEKRLTAVLSAVQTLQCLCLVLHGTA